MSGRRASSQSSRGRRCRCVTRAARSSFSTFTALRPSRRAPTSSTTSSSRLDADGLARGGAVEDELAVLGVDSDGVALAEVAFEQPQGQRVLDHPLDRTLERPGAVRRVPAGFGQDVLRLVGELELDAAVGESDAETLQLQLDD